MPAGETAGAALKSAGFVLPVTVKVSAWPASSAGPALMAVAQGLTVCAPGVFRRRRIRARREAGRVVDGRDRDGEGLRRGGVDAAVGVPPLSCSDQRDRRGAAGVGGRRVGQRAGRRDRGRGAEERRVGVAGDIEGEVCAASSAGPGLIAVAQAGDGLRAGVFEDRLIRALGEARRGVDAGDRDRERLRRGGVDPAVGGAAVVLRRQRDRRRAGVFAAVV